ncbi:prenyltransferase [Catenulispora pinisilvae]|uniref:prenyltransferase n=1 Tax=Catenulispora pinisilvae TaxID=2705253 RepID=UPI001E43AD71|nr:prenyltransferase [Catenulispora pinisilvae]
MTFGPVTESGELAAAAELLACEGVLNAEQVRTTVAGIAALQRPDGAIPWFHGGHLDPWDHIEAAMALDVAALPDRALAAYRWLAASQNSDGSWYAAYADAPAGVSEPTNRLCETNFSAYLAVGVWHHWLATGDEDFLAEMWPPVRRAMDFVLSLQSPGGEIVWCRDEQGREADEALLTGCSSMYQALRCALAIAERVGSGRPDWELACGRLGHALAAHPERFADKGTYSMDWYYPVLGTALRGQAAERRIAAGWDAFVVRDLGVRCVSTNPWVTGGETCELALALWAIGDAERARMLLRDIQHLRDDADGMYWTGRVYEADDEGHRPAIWPREKTAWTAGALLLALAALAEEKATVAVFGGDGLPEGMLVACSVAECVAV